MRKKRVLVLVAALVACLAVGSATVATAKLKKKKFAATITLSVSVTPANAPYTQGSGTFSGKVSSGGPKGCRSGRTVTFSGPTAVPAATTDANGNYSSTISTRPAAGNYTATVAKRVIVKKKKNKKFICKAATSPIAVVPPA